MKNKKVQQRNVNQRSAELVSIVTAKKRALQNAPEGFLRITSSHGKEQYYQMKPGKPRLQVYLSPSEDFQFIQKLAQKSYDIKVLRAAEQELKAWKQLAEFFPDMTVEEVYETLSPVRQKMVEPIRKSDEEYRKEWESVTWTPLEFEKDAPVYITDRGERVRSKSEQLIANMLNRLNIPYRYEYPLTLNVRGRKRTFHPDFTILDVRNRKVYYLEHFGMMDDDSESNNYARRAFWKIQVYEENGMYEGKNMIFSYETRKAPLNINYLEQKVKRTLGLS